VKRLRLAAVDTAARHRIVQQLATGAAIVYRRRADALTAWVAAGRRDDLTGWRAALGPAVRLLLLAAAGALAYRTVRAVPWLMWLLAAASLRAAWRASGHSPAEAVEEQLDEPPSGPDLDAVLTLLHTVLGGRDRVHLSTVLAHLQQQGQAAGWTVADLRARLEALKVPVRPKVKIGRVPTRGVLLADLQAHFPDWEMPPSPAQVDAA
jgi:hypothetical protein